MKKDKIAREVNKEKFMYFNKEDIKKAAHQSNQDQREMMELTPCDCLECRLRKSAKEPIQPPPPNWWERLKKYLGLSVLIIAVIFLGGCTPDKGVSVTTKSSGWTTSTLELEYTTSTVKIINIDEILSEMSTENVYKVWDESGMSTQVHYRAYAELKKRRYWEEKDLREIKESFEILDKYSN